MKSFNWNSYFVTGLPEVDDQHHRLVDIINEFGTLLAENDVDMSDVDKLFGELTDYAAYHFREEETLMTAAGVDSRHVERHIHRHESFLSDVTSLYEGGSRGYMEQAETLLEFLVHWLAYHILGQDQDMARQIRAIESGAAPDAAYSKLERERSAETAPLLDALNNLFELVSSRNRELKQLNENLEKKVALRTRELYEANLQLEELSLTDVLTGLPNRRHALRLLSDCWRDSLKNKLPLVCMMVDADHFKEVNDVYGHDAGDRVLVELANTLRHCFRNDDAVCRLGGDEFFVICPETDIEGGMRIAEQARRTVAKLRAPTEGEPWHGRISISIGIASREPGMKSCEELIKAADMAVYAAKSAGKNCVRAAADSPGNTTAG